MTWFKVDDSFYDHPKVFDAPDCAVALWTRAGTWSARNLTDGFVPAGMPARFCDDPDRAIAELLRRRLWERASGGYRFHDWQEYQPTRSEAIASASKMSSGGSLGNHRRWHLGEGRQSDSCRYCQPKQESATRSLPDRPPEGVGDRPPNPPTRPVPAPTGSSSLTLTTDHARATPEPPRRCQRHLEHPDPPACGSCADARRSHDRWTLEQGERRRAAPQCERHRGQLAGSCALCRSEELGAA